MHPDDEPDPCRDLSPPEDLSNSAADYTRPFPTHTNHVGAKI